ncbi:MAG: type II toxin-antitoxin system RelE/ParE family toxin [Streptococcaceae bacterium]|jgi:toxin ParE1/3/4|nr:type II toxin-antitoxin system RelE/ParE family toxin [Streptococcaceae bacterium]
MAYKLKITPEAEKDLDEIRDYIATRFMSEQALTNTLGGIRDTILKLSDFPEIGIDVSQRVNKQFSKKHTLRMIIAGSYLVFYVFDGRGVSVLRVLYQKRDWVTIFR